MSQSPQKENAPKKDNEPSFHVNDFRAHFDQEKNSFTNFQPRRFIPCVQPKIDLFSTITIYGKRRTGKSVFIKWFIQHYKQYFPWVWVFTKTKQNNFYPTFIPDKFILPDFDAVILDKIMNRQKKGIEGYLGKEKDLNPRAAIIWDDYSGNDIKFNSKLNEYYYTGRHYATMNFFCAQVLNFN